MMEDKDVIAPVVCTPDPTGRVLVTLCGIVSLVFVAIAIHTPPRSAGDWVAFGSLLTFFLVLGVGVTIHERVCRIVADEDGLSWRGVRGERRAAWSEVSDYYDHQFGSSNGRYFEAVVIVGGARLRFDKSWRNSGGIKAAIVLNAKDAKADRWELLGARTNVDRPQVFGYSGITGNGRLLMIIVANLIALNELYDTPYHAYVKSIARFHHVEPYTIAMLAMHVSLWVMMLVTLNAMLLSGYTEFLKRKKETITFDRETLTFSDGVSALTARWDEVTDYYWTSSPSDMIKMPIIGRIETPGGPICFLRDMDKGTRLARIVELYASKARQHEWRIEDSWQSLEPAAPATDHQRGIKRFGYRNRFVRFFAVMATLLIAAPILIYLLHHIVSLPSGKFGAGIAVVPFVLACYLWSVFNRSAVVVDDDSIIKISPLGQRRIGWDNVRYVCLYGAQSPIRGLVKSDHCTIIITESVTNVADLLIEIERRSLNATIEKSG